MKMLFSESLKRLELLKHTKTENASKIEIAIYRNHSFELISNVLNTFLSFSNLYADFIFSDYDDSLNFQFKEACIQIIWLDLNRYKTNDLSSFINERLVVLRNLTKNPIMLIVTGDQDINITNDIPDVTYINISKELSSLGEKLYDYKKEKYSGTILSDKATLEIARILGLKYIPSILFTPLKAIVADLDNTLYQGILGEDGIKNLIPNIEFQQQLKDLKERGFLLAIASKNELSDVKEMFKERKDFILEWSDFTTVEINWNSKADNLINIAKKFNIGLDSILFIDDNPGEIENVSHIGVNTLLADENITQILKYYPRLLKLNTNEEDRIRSIDIQSNQKRIELANKLSPCEYFKKLGIKLTYFLNNKSQIPRITELLNKTNQFILSYKRYNQSEVQTFIEEKDKGIFTIQMSDNLSDSGIIAIFVFHKEQNDLFVDELTVSCRALGRNLENVMLPYLFILAKQVLNTSNIVKIEYKKGDRNKPAIDWLSKLINQRLQNEGLIEFNISNNVNLEGLQVNIL